MLAEVRSVSPRFAKVRQRRLDKVRKVLFWFANDVRHGSLAFEGCARVRSGSHKFTMVCNANVRQDAWFVKFW